MTSSEIEAKKHDRKSKSRRRWDDEENQVIQNSNVKRVYEEDDPFAPLDSLRDSVNFEKKLGEKHEKGRISALYEDVNEERDISEDLLRLGYTQSYLRETHELSAMPRTSHLKNM